MRTTVMTLLMSMGLVLGAGTASGQGTGAPPPLPLAGERAAALDPVLEAALILDATKPAPAKLARFNKACLKLSTTDELLRSFRSACRAEGDAFTAGLRLPSCKSSDRCRARLHRYAANLATQADKSRRLNAKLKLIVPGYDCRSALRITQGVLGALSRLRAGALKLEAAVRSGTAKQVADGVARFYAIDRSPLLDHRGRLDRFRAACV